MHGSQLAALDVLGDLEGVRLQIIPRAVRQMLLFELSDDSKFDNLKKLRFISGDSRQCGDLDSFMNGCQSCKNKKDNV